MQRWRKPGWIRDKWSRGTELVVDMQSGGTLTVSRRRLGLEVAAGGRRRGRARSRRVDVVKEDMKLVGVREEDPEDMVRRRQMIGCGPGQKGTVERRRRYVYLLIPGRQHLNGDTVTTCT